MVKWGCDCRAADDVCGAGLEFETLVFVLNGESLFGVQTHAHRSGN